MRRSTRSCARGETSPTDWAARGRLTGLLTGILGSLLGACLIAMFFPDPGPLEGQRGPLEYEARGAVVASDDPDELCTELHVRVDPSGDRCRLTVTLDDGTEVARTASCEPHRLEQESLLELEGLTSDGFAMIELAERAAGADG